MYVFVGTSDYLPSANKWLLYIDCIILATLYESNIHWGNKQFRTDIVHM